MTNAADVKNKNTDDFFETAAQIFRDIRNEGLVALNPNAYAFAYESVEKHFAAGVDYLKDALLPDVFHALLEWKEALIWKEMSFRDLDAQEVLEFTLLKRILRYYHAGDTENFLDMCNQVCTHHCSNHCDFIVLGKYREP